MKRDYLIAAGVVVLLIIGLGVNHYNSQTRARNECVQQVFSRFPNPTVQNGTLDSYANALGYCSKTYSFWR